MRAANTDPKMLKLLGVGAAATLLALAPTAASAGKFKVLYSFCAAGGACADGELPTPNASLVMDQAGNLYGTTEHGGSRSEGVAFELKRTDAGKYKYHAIWSFFGHPSGGLIIDTQGNLYGQAGSFFKLSYGFGNHHNKWQLGDLNVSCSQACGTRLAGSLTYQGASSGAPWDGASPLYGATPDGGANGAGTVFELTPGQSSWTETVLYNFCSQGGAECTDGDSPQGGPVLDDAGNLFGTTIHGGGHDLGQNGGGAGVAYEVAQQSGSWTETVLHAFCSEGQCVDGAEPSGLSTDGLGNLFGTTGAGGGKCHIGSNGCGVLFKLVANGQQSQETVLYAFCRKRDCADGYAPSAPPIIGNRGELLGTTENGGGNDIDRFGRGGGVIYELDGASYDILHQFCSLPNCADGEYPEAALVVDLAGNAIGTTGTGGDFDAGVAFSMQPK